MEQNQKKRQEEALHDAIVRNDPEAVKNLLDLGVDASARRVVGVFDENRTMLHVAAYMGRVLICQMLLARGAEVNGLFNSRSTPLHEALSGATVAAPDRQQVVSLLLQHGANPNAVDARATHAPLHFAIDRSGLSGRLTDWSTLIRMLVDHGADPSFIPAGGRSDLQGYLTPFQYCVAKGQVEHLQIFLREYGQDPGQKTAAGRTMLQLCGASRPRIRSELKTHLHAQKTEQNVCDALRSDLDAPPPLIQKRSVMSPL